MMLSKGSSLVSDVSIGEIFTRTQISSNVNMPVRTGVVVDACTLIPLSKDASHRWLIHTAEGQVPARFSASCLLTPQLNDTVLMMEIDRQWWITAVLVASGRERVVLQVAGAQELVLQAPVLTLGAQQRCHVDSPVIDVKTQNFSLQAHTAQLTASALSVVAQCFTAMARRISAFSDQLTATCRVRTVQVEEVDTLDTCHAVTTAETSTLQAGQVVLNARETVRVDAARIMMG